MNDDRNLGDKMKLPWNKMPIAGAMFNPGSAVEYRTGEWRVAFEPVIDHEKCTMCLLCWIFCPDVSIIRTEKKIEVDYDHCKGCGICATECPVKAIEMVKVQ